MKKVKIGVIGCGMISHIYLKNFTSRFEHIEVIACADMLTELAAQRAKEFNIPNVLTPDELLHHPEVEIVVNLTSPVAHGPINMKALEQGKHVYVEKPIAISKEEAEQINELAKEKGLLVGVAPDTILGGGLQTCRKILDDGMIGTAYAARATILMGNGSSMNHVNIENFFKRGGEPLFDMGVYYLSALVSLLGGVRRVTGSATRLYDEFTVENPASPRVGDKIKVEMPTNVSAVLDFHSGVIGNLTVAKESFGYTPILEIYGTDGILYANDPNMFGGPIQVLKRSGEKVEISYTHGYSENARGLGVADMVEAIQSGRENRASGKLAFHVLDIMEAIYESSEKNQHVFLESTCQRPEPMPSLVTPK